MLRRQFALLSLSLILSIPFSVFGQMPTSGFRGYLTNSSDFTSSSSTTLTNLKFSNVQFNTAGLTVQSDGSLLVTQAGLYSLSAHVDAWPESTAPYVRSLIAVNGTVLDQTLSAATTNKWTAVNSSFVRQLSVGDTISVKMQPSDVLFMDNGNWSTLNVVHHGAVASSPSATAFRGQLTNASDFTTPSTGSFTTLKFSNVELNTAGLTVQADGSILITQAGLYSFTGHVDAVPEPGAPYVQSRILVNGVVADNHLMSATTGRWNALSNSFVRQFNVGDTVTFQMLPNQISSMDTGTWSTLNAVRHETINSNPSAVGFRGLLTNATDFTSSSSATATNLKFSTVELNTAGLTVQADGSMIVTRAGLYSISGHLDAIAEGAPSNIPITILLNDVVVDQTLMTPFGSAWNAVEFSYLDYLSVGDKLSIRTVPGLISAMDNGDWSTLNIVVYTAVPESRGALAAAAACLAMLCVLHRFRQVRFSRAAQGAGR